MIIYVCPHNGEQSKCKTCKGIVPHRVEAVPTEDNPKPFCSTHKIALVAKK